MADLDDIDLPNPEDGQHGLPEAHTVKELMDQCERDIAEYQGRYLPQAIYNERMCEGEQFIDLTDSADIVNSDWPDYVPKAARNLLRNLRLTWSSRILEDRPFVKPYPKDPGVDELRAQAADRYLEFIRQRIDFDDLCFRAAQLVQVHSAVGFKTVWDPLKGPPSDGFEVLDEETGDMVIDGEGEPTGEVSIELVSIFDYGTDGAEEIEDSKWVMFWKYINPHDARVLLQSSGADVEKLFVENFTDIWGVKQTGVKVTELWWKPDYRFPDGLFCVKVGDVVVQATKYPYAHGELPISVWKCGPRRGSPYGSTHVDDAVYIQKVINETVAAIWQQARQIGSVKLLAPPAVAEQWEHGNQILKIADPDHLQYTRYLEPPNRAGILVETLQDNIEAIYNVYGLNEMLSGAENIKSGTSARSIAYLNKLDSMKLAGASRSLGKALRRMMRQALRLAQEWVVTERMEMILGDQTGLGAVMFTGADFEGIDVILEDASAVSSYRATVAEDAKQSMMQGGPTPELQSTAATGLQDSAYTRSQMDIVGAQIQMIMQGQPQEPTPEVDPEIAVGLLTQVLSAAPQGSPQHQGLLMLLQQYQDAASQAQQQQQQEDLAMKAAGGGKNVPKV